MPSIASISLMLMVPPLPRTSSIIFSASTMGVSSSISCIVKYRLRSMLVASTMLMMPVLFANDELPGHDLLAGIGRHGVDAGQVGDFGIGVLPDGTALAVHRHAREIAHMLVGPVSWLNRVVLPQFWLPASAK